MRLPTSFELAGSVWSVVQVPNLAELGRCIYDERVIQLRKEQTKQAKEQAFWHEAMHAVMFTLGKATHDEEFVDAMGALIHQLVKTMK